MSYLCGYLEGAVGGGSERSQSASDCLGVGLCDLESQSGQVLLEHTVHR